MDPEVPQALRLQAILVGGIVIVHARQQVYLLEDAQEMLVGPRCACWVRACCQLLARPGSQGRGGGPGRLLRGSAACMVLALLWFAGCCTSSRACR